MADSKLTSKFQATIPQEIRSLLHLKAGDRIIFEIKKNQAVLIRKATSLDIAYLKSLETTLSEWSSESDDEAFRDL